MKTPALLIRADASVQIGTGHAMRMIALAQAWQRRGGQAHLLSAELPPAVADRVIAASIRLHALDDALTVGDTGDQDRTVEVAQRIGAQWVVVDGYHFSRDFQTAVRNDALRLAVVTDFDYCQPWSCDMIINQNPHAKAETYACDVEDCQRLLGTRYVLLRREFLSHCEAQHSPSPDRPRRVLMTLGGSDAANTTGAILTALDQCRTDPMEIRVLIGSANPHQSLLQKQAASSPHSIELLVSVNDMPAQYTWADAVITAGGSSCWEWMYFGLDAAVVVIADNQQPIYDELVQANMAIGLGGTHIGVDVSRLQTFVQNIHRESRQPDRFRQWVDGYGADRIAAALDSGVWLRAATQRDCQMYFDWANDPLVRQHALQTDEIPWSDHVEWFHGQLASDQRRLFVAMRAEQPVGQIRFSQTPDGTWLIAYSIADQARDCGLGDELLRLGIAAMQFAGEQRFVATVKHTNTASAKCFDRLGWCKTMCEETYEYRNQ